MIKCHSTLHWVNECLKSAKHLTVKLIETEGSKSTDMKASDLMRPSLTISEGYI